MRFKIASPRFGSTSISSFLGGLTMTIDETSRQHLDQMALSLGRLVITCSQLENDLTMTIAEIMSLNEVQERGLVRPMKTSVKLSLLNRLATDFLKSARHQERVKKVTTAIKNATEARNDLVHGEYVHDPNKKVAIISFSKGASL